MSTAANTSQSIESITRLLADSKSVRETLPSGGRVHIDRHLPFICVHQDVGEPRQAAYDIATSNASYLVTPDIATDLAVINQIGRQMVKHFGAFLVILVSEFEQDDLLADDSPYLPTFRVRLQTELGEATQAALEATAGAIGSVKVKYRSPDIDSIVFKRSEHTELSELDQSIGLLTIRFAPIYRQPDSEAVYPELRERVVGNVFDALLHGAAAFVTTTGSLFPATHRALGRSGFVDAVRKLDKQIDKVSSSFDFLLAITPINTRLAWEKFKGNESTPDLLYRPLTVNVNAEKAALHSISFENLEDPLLYEIYRDKQYELDLQLTAISLRDTTQFREASRLLYGPVEPELLQIAQNILALQQNSEQAQPGEGGQEGDVDCHDLKEAACKMLADYHLAYDGFDAEVVIRDDLPAGLMVSGSTLMISRHTRMASSRVDALLSHEIGVHLMTYFSGDAQGLKIFRTGLAGYEGVQEGLGVFAEYLAGGLTLGRLRLLAARVIGCAAMLEGADFTETYRLLTQKHDFSDSAAFNLTIRLYRSGGLAKDAIYLRGLRDVLDHIGAGKSLDPFWLGKFSINQLPIIEELSARRLLKSPPVTPFFLTCAGAEQRLDAARAGMAPDDLFSK